MASGLENIETIESPFRRFVTTIGVFPTAFTDAMTYYECLAYLVKYLEETVIPAVNENAEAVEELQDKYIDLRAELLGLYHELKEYVDHYFDTLDLQTEVDAKLDQMVIDGTLANIINQEIFSELNNKIGDLSNLNTTDKTSLVNATNEVLDYSNTVVPNSIMNKIRKKYYSRYVYTVLPDGFNNFFKSFSIIHNDAKKYSVEFDESAYINQGGTTYYIAPNGDNNNNGTSESTPLYSISNFLSRCNAGDTLIFLDGIYARQQFAGANIGKSVNLIGKNPNKVWLKTDDASYTWTNDTTYTNLWYTSRAGVGEVIDITNREKGEFVKLTKVTTISDCNDTDNSYYINGSTIYLHYKGGIEPDSNVALDLNVGLGSINLNGFTANTLVYIKNINLLNSDSGGIIANNSTTYSVTLFVDNCKLYNNFSNGYQYDAFSNIGCYSICRNVVANNSLKDGFNYHDSTNSAIGIEIDCESINCGYGQTASGKLSNNSTTAHQNAQVIRVNGKYGYCNGGCVVDINTAKGALYGCTIFDSYGRSYDVLADNNAVMYVIDCYFKGSSANTNMEATSGSYVYYNDGTEFDTKLGDNVIKL